MRKETAAKVVNRINKQIDENLEVLNLLLQEFSTVDTLMDYRIIELEAAYLEKQIKELKQEINKINTQTDPR